MKRRHYSAEFCLPTDSNDEVPKYLAKYSTDSLNEFLCWYGAAMTFYQAHAKYSNDTLIYVLCDMNGDTATFSIVNMGSEVIVRNF